MKYLLTVISFFFIFIVSEAQNGSPLLTNFRESSDAENQSWAICQDRNKVMLFANRKGILAFDGEDWSPVNITVTPFSMALNPVDNRVYVGGDNSFGYLKRDQRGNYVYKLLSGDSAKTGMISRILFNDTLAFFYGEGSITFYDFRKEKIVNRLVSKTGSPFTGMFSTPKNIFVNVAGKGLYRIEGDTLFPIVTGYLTEKNEILFSLPYDKKMVLLGLGSGKLSLFDGLKYYDFPVHDNGYINGSLLSDGIAMGDSLYAFSTLEGGAVVVERYSGRVRHIINNQKGLPDDEVFAIGNDCGGGLWVSHQFGLTRADLNLPIGDFGIYPGLRGNLTASVRHNGELYVATSEGVFYLTEQKNYSEVEVKKENSAQGNQPEANQKQPVRKGIFARIFGKKNNQEKKAVTTANVQKIRQLKSVDYIFRKVTGMNEKCRQLVSTPYGILAATNRGLFVVADHNASLLTDGHYVNFISWKQAAGKYLVTTGDGYFIADHGTGRWTIIFPDKKFTEPVYSACIDSRGTSWLGGDNVALKTEPGPEGTIVYKRYKVEEKFPQRYFVKFLNDTLFLFTETSISYYSNGSDSFLPYKKYLTQQSEAINLPLSNIALFRAGNNWKNAEKNDELSDIELSMLRLFDDVLSVYCESRYIWISDAGNHLFGIRRIKSTKSLPATELLVKNIRNEKGTRFDLSDVVFDRGDNVINFDIIAPTYVKADVTEYQYYINKVMKDWSPWSTRTSYSRGIPRPGDYKLQIRARDIWGTIGEPATINFRIKAPFVQTTLFYGLVISVVLFILYVFVRLREEQLKEKNRILEEKVKERTAEIAAQKEEITSSIEYASRIQLAMLPVRDLFTQSFSDYFIIFKPRDIVSGDFYWIGESGNNVFITVADCTGHGVPGAFMSTLGISTLNEIITNNDNLQANTVLNLLREKIKRSLHQTGKQGEAADGMDISFCILNRNRRILQYSGAYNPLFVFSGEELREYKADRMPIGIHYGEEAAFTNYEIKMNKDDVFYLLSDGFTDQFGGPEGTKYKKANLKRLLSSVHSLTMHEQRAAIEDELKHWKGRLDQVDDITVMGIRV